MESQPRIFGSDDARQMVAGQVVNLKSSLRATLRALAACAARGLDARMARQLIDRGHALTLQLSAAIDALDDSGPSRDARVMANELEQRLAALERLVDARPLVFS